MSDDLAIVEVGSVESDGALSAVQPKPNLMEHALQALHLGGFDGDRQQKHSWSGSENIVYAVCRIWNILWMDNFKEQDLGP